MDETRLAETKEAVRNSRKAFDKAAAFHFRLAEGLIVAMTRIDDSRKAVEESWEMMHKADRLLERDPRPRLNLPGVYRSLLALRSLRHGESTARVPGGGEARWAGEKKLRVTATAP